MNIVDKEISGYTLKLMDFNGLKYHVVLLVGEEIVNSSSFTFTIKL